MSAQLVRFHQLQIGDRFEIPFSLPRNPAGFPFVYTRSTGQTVVDEHGGLCHWPASENARPVNKLAPLKEVIP